ncbi:uncharacterized protein MELLADRAFT_110304 [Melampsora larici-populina 98AG31]|uniref:Uncharacterized protein n=1 Tax=Melampsora larici-populina (strain 98AG31 / pathotype 3-4-7) TaxID=747676 RepID=F4RZB7_MELLP|nr:uncharacterized protein MELLADRAFT_110304 [Melampsora larici-populina 98AG31]EGG02196.1 hypothetical protein MELLADRAFT_110304 [Melampsora larici-populina 98AG31]
MKKKSNQRSQSHSHWNVKQPNSNHHQPTSILKNPVKPEKLDLPFVEGCHHIGSRFSVNTLIKSIQPVNLTSEEVGYLKNRHNHSKSASDDLSDLYPRIKGPYQPRSILSRTRSAYGLKPRKKSNNPDDEEFDETNEVKSNQNNVNKGDSNQSIHHSRPPSNLEQYERQFHPEVYQSKLHDHQPKSVQLHPVREEEEIEELSQVLQIDEDYESWVLKALEPIPHSNSISISNLSNSQIGSYLYKSQLILL